MLQVNASKRPSIDALAASEVLCSKRGRDGDVAPEDDADRIELLKTIKVPRSKHQLTHALPKPCYPDSRPNSPAAWPATNRARKTELLQRRESSRHSFAENPSPASTEGSSALDAAIARVDELLGRKAAPLSPSRKAAKVAPVAFDGRLRDRKALPLQPGSPTSPLPINGGKISSLVRGAMRDVDDERLMRAVESRSRRGAPASPGRRQAQGEQDAPRDGKRGPGFRRNQADPGPYPRPRAAGVPRVAYLAGRDHAPAAKIQAALAARGRGASSRASRSPTGSRGPRRARRPGQAGWWG
ncbi:hypothetical protein JL722_1166 [Aureococcus anophagefferens]|nr:hypothetical protein JL722_1166 [Aureococcus anophagefferens]